MDERGAAHLTLSVLLLGSMLMLGLAVDVARFAASWREAAHIAATAAEAGAGWIDEEAARAGRLEVDPAPAFAAASAVAGSLGQVTATREAVCVTVRIEVRPGLLAIVGAAPKEARAEACAEPRQG